MRYRYRIELTSVQQQMLARVFGYCRVVFNHALGGRDKAYRAGMKLSDSEIQRRVTAHAKTTEERGWLCEVSSVALVQLVNDSRPAWRNFFDSRLGKCKDRNYNPARIILAAGRAERLNVCGASVSPPAIGEARDDE